MPFGCSDILKVVIDLLSRFTRLIGKSRASLRFKIEKSAAADMLAARININ